MLSDCKTVILADGEFPAHSIPLDILKGCSTVICCDGAAVKLMASGIRVPDYIVGDLDSINEVLLMSIGDRVVRLETQDTNDLTKAVEFALSKGLCDIVILGATGLREDHTLGNISLLAEYSVQATVKMVTNYGTMVAIRTSTSFDSFPGQQVSVFSMTPDIPFTYKGLKWDINSRPLKLWWEGTLNESLSDSFSVEFENGLAVVFLQHGY